MIYKAWLFLFFQLSLCAQLVLGQTPTKLGKATDAQLSEISGIVPYAYRENYFWVHNDSGDKTAIYLIDEQANLKVTVEISGARFIDIEEIARFYIGNKSYLAIADMGNNLRNRDVLSLYIIEEPHINPTDHLNL